jgi:hypothetical protein
MTTCFKRTTHWQSDARRRGSGQPSRGYRVGAGVGWPPNADSTPQRLLALPASAADLIVMERAADATIASS